MLFKYQCTVDWSIALMKHPWLVLFCFLNIYLTFSLSTPAVLTTSQLSKRQSWRIRLPISSIVSSVFGGHPRCVTSCKKEEFSVALEKLETCTFKQNLYSWKNYLFKPSESRFWVFEGYGKVFEWENGLYKYTVKVLVSY